MAFLNRLLQAVGGTYAVYRYHAAQPLGDTSRPTAWASHYTGKTIDMDMRDGKHHDGTGAKLLRAATARGIPFQLETIYACANEQLADDLEIWFKVRSHARHFCSVCQALADDRLPPVQPVVIRVERLSDITGRNTDMRQLRERLFARRERAAERRGHATEANTWLLPPPAACRLPPPHELLTEAEARARGTYVSQPMFDLSYNGNYPLDPVSDEELQIYYAAQGIA